MATRSDKQWEKIGGSSPLYGVWTQDIFRDGTPDNAALKKFWMSGEQYIEKVFTSIEKHFPEKSAPKQALDYGCGVGRLMVPLSQKCDNVVGIDVSPSMLSRASNYLAERNITNVTTICAGDADALEDGSYDLIHSFIVLQHIQPNRGYHIIGQLIKKLKSGGTGVIHLTYQNNSPMKKFHWLLRLPIPDSLIKFFTRGKLAGPVMEMNEYSLNTVFAMIQRSTKHHLHIELTNHGAYGVIIYFKKN